MAKMDLVRAKAECVRWFAYLDRQREKSIELQKIAAARRDGSMTEDEARRKIRALDNCSVTVFDGAELEKAVKVLLRHC